ncbi:MAG TPA: hypothetical protein VJV05_02275 [Pyrinomonadaceae bacterium]|nr:hypothetical protein [Pyrinomonadaceae bacterium]
MQNRDLKDKEFDRIAAVVVRSTSVSESEIEDIVRNPALFNQVRARINAGPEKVSAAFVVLGFIRRNAAAVSGVLLISIAAISFGLFRTTKAPATVSGPIASTNNDPKPSYKKHSEPDNLVEARQATDIEGPRPQKVSMDRPATPRISPQKTSASTKRRVDFYAVSYAGDPNETERGARIIRVDMSRSALFAMGVDIPLENDAEVIKADLLVGNDGVTRAIRVVE